MAKPKLVSIHIYEEIDKIRVNASFKNEEIQGLLRTINVNLALPKNDPRGVEEIEELAAAKAERIFEKMFDLMIDLAPTSGT